MMLNEAPYAIFGKKVPAIESNNKSDCLSMHCTCYDVDKFISLINQGKRTKEPPNKGQAGDNNYKFYCFVLCSEVGLFKGFQCIETTESIFWGNLSYVCRKFAWMRGT